MAAYSKASLEGSQFVDRLLAFFAGAAIALWFLGGLTESSLENFTLDGTESNTAIFFNAESTTILTRLSEELIYEAFGAFKSEKDDLPFASVGRDGQVSFLSIEGSSQSSAEYLAVSHSPNTKATQAHSVKVIGSNAYPRLEVISQASRLIAESRLVKGRQQPTSQQFEPASRKLTGSHKKRENLSVAQACPKSAGFNLSTAQIKWA